MTTPTDRLLMSKRKKPWIGPQFASLFASARPAIPWEIADIISITLADHAIESVGVTGSLHPSILTAIGYGAPSREINGFAMESVWTDLLSWNIVRGDSFPGMEGKYPSANDYLPVNFALWDGASPFVWAEAIFTDLPIGHALVGLKLEHLDRREHPLVLLGFLHGYEGPDDLLSWLDDRYYLSSRGPRHTRLQTHRGDEMIIKRCART